MSSGFWKARARVDRADSLFSRYICKMRDGNKCQRCGADGRSVQLENSHFVGRAAESTRFEPENCDALCRSCHSFFEDKKGVDKFLHNGVRIEKPQAYREWKIKQLGAVRFAALEVRGDTFVHKDRKMSLIYVKALISEWERRHTENIIGRKA